jgi:hypothetical protein
MVMPAPAMVTTTPSLMAPRLVPTPVMDRRLGVVRLGRSGRGAGQHGAGNGENA